MDANAMSLKKIFRKDIRYDVPRFQRPYVWEEEEHWQLLWGDLRNTAEKLLDNREKSSVGDSTRHNPEEETDPHFLGAMVFDQKTNLTSELENREVVDGQQRLITLQVFLSSAYSVAEQLGYHEEANMFEKLMYNDDDLVEQEEQQLKVWPIEPDQPAFKSAMLDSFEEDTDNHLVTKCHDFFEKSIHDWITSKDNEEELMEALRKTLWKLIHIVVIDLANEDDSQVIFETLNARGTPLLAADLIKNYLFREARKEGLDTDRLHKKYWDQFDEDYWREDISQGRLERPRIDVFIMHWLTMRKGDEIRAKKLFPEFQDFIKKTSDSVEDLLSDINKYAEIYEDFSEQNSTGRKSIFFRRLEIIETTTPYPVLLWMAGEGFPDDQKTTAMEAIESWLIRRMLCHLTTKNYNRIFLNLLSELKENKVENIDEKIIQFFSRREEESGYWPGNEELRESMVNDKYWGRTNQDRLKMVFRALERELRDTGYSESIEIDEKLEIEHLLPREWALNWDLPGDKAQEVEKIERNEILHRIGNLTVLTDQLNPKVSNAAWETKRENIRDHTTILLNQNIVNNYWEEWNEETIEERAKELAGTTSRVWPSPNSNYW